jgi:hypothetical protein
MIAGSTPIGKCLICGLWGVRLWYLRGHGFSYILKAFSEWSNVRNMIGGPGCVMSGWRWWCERSVVLVLSVLFQAHIYQPACHATTATWARWQCVEREIHLLGDVAWNRKYWDLRQKRRETMKQKHSQNTKERGSNPSSSEGCLAFLTTVLLSFHVPVGQCHATWGFSNRTHVMQPLRWDVWEGAFHVPIVVSYQLNPDWDCPQANQKSTSSKHWQFIWCVRLGPLTRFHRAAWHMHKIMQATRHNLTTLSTWHSDSHQQHPSWASNLTIALLATHRAQVLNVPLNAWLRIRSAAVQYLPNRLHK